MLEELQEVNHVRATSRWQKNLRETYSVLQTDNDKSAREKAGRGRVSLSCRDEGSCRDEKRRSNALEVGTGNVLNVASDTSNVGIVERGIDLVEHEEGRRVVAVQIRRKVSFGVKKSKGKYSKRTSE